MADDLSDFTIFRLSAAPSLREIIGSFSGFRELASPVTGVEAAPFTFYTIAAYSEKDVSILPVFTDPALIKPPYAAKPPLLFLQTLFAAPDAGIFAFNPGKGLAVMPARERQLPGEVRLSKLQLSAAIGFLQNTAPPPAGAQLEAAVRNEAGLGNLHRANYLASLLLAGKPAGDPYGLYAEILINLGLLQEAYDYIRHAQSPEFSYYKALTLRLAGDTAKARLWLEKIPGETSLEDKKKLELAWLALEEGRTDEALAGFRPLSEKSFEKTGALFGLGCALMKKELAEKTPAANSGVPAAFLAALNSPSPLLPDIYLQLGNHNFRAGNHADAARWYGKAAGLRPSVQTNARRALSLIRTGELPEAAALINELALTDPASAGRLAAELPRDRAAALLAAARQHRDAPGPVPAGNAVPAAKEGGLATASLEAAGLRAVTPPRGVPLPPAPATPPQGVRMESLMESARAASLLSETETRKDDFMGRAFKLASSLEDEFSRKIYFNADGLAEVEKKLRLTFIKPRQNPQEAVETVKDCAAFLCFVLQEKFKGRLLKLPDFDHWGWPMVFNAPKRLVTYPVQRAWKLLWDGALPEPGWLIKYLRYVEDELRDGSAAKPQGAAAVQARAASDPERITDAQTEHKRILILTATLEETSRIELGRTGIVKLEKALHDNFKPEIPPTADGWKLLRCYGHMLAEILAQDFKAAWYNTDGNDGLWSMQLPWRTFVFPIGKVYKSASGRESLTAFYDVLLADKLRASR